MAHFNPVHPSYFNSESSGVSEGINGFFNVLKNAMSLAHGLQQYKGLDLSNKLAQSNLDNLPEQQKQAREKHTAEIQNKEALREESEARTRNTNKQTEYIPKKFDQEERFKRDAGVHAWEALKQKDRHFNQNLAFNKKKQEDQYFLGLGANANHAPENRYSNPLFTETPEKDTGLFKLF